MERPVLAARSTQSFYVEAHANVAQTLPCQRVNVGLSENKGYLILGPYNNKDATI